MTRDNSTSSSLLESSDGPWSQNHFMPSRRHWGSTSRCHYSPRLFLPAVRPVRAPPAEERLEVLRWDLVGIGRSAWPAQRAEAIAVTACPIEPLGCERRPRPGAPQSLRITRGGSVCISRSQPAAGAARGPRAGACSGTPFGLWAPVGRRPECITSKRARSARLLGASSIERIPRLWRSREEMRSADVVRLGIVVGLEMETLTALLRSRRRAATSHCVPRVRVRLEGRARSGTAPVPRAPPVVLTRRRRRSRVQRPWPRSACDGPR
jgi:hypothetical protein